MKLRILLASASLAALFAAGIAAGYRRAGRREEPCPVCERQR